MIGMTSQPRRCESPFTVSRTDLVQAIEAELKDYFDDGIGPTLGQYAIDHIIGGIVGRVNPHDEPSDASQCEKRKRREHG